MPRKHANYFHATDRGSGASIHAFRFCVFLPEDLSTCHTWLAIMAIDVYTHRFSESLGLRLCGPGQKALQAMNEFTLFVDFCPILLSKTCGFDVPAKNL